MRASPRIAAEGRSEEDHASDGIGAKQRKVLENAKGELRVLFDKGE